MLIFLCGSVDSVLDYWCIFLFGKAKENIAKTIRIDTFQAIGEVLVMRDLWLTLHSSDSILCADTRADTCIIEMQFNSKRPFSIRTKLAI